jgi:hypothetical protein
MIMPHTKPFALRTPRAATLLAMGLLLASCGSDEAGTSSIAMADAPAFASLPGSTEGLGSATATLGQQVIGKWRERIVNADGTLNAREYRRIAASYNTSGTMNYRLGPTAADFGNSTNTDPQLWGPDLKSGFGLWTHGTVSASDPKERAKCVAPANLPRSDEEARARGMEGPAWLTGGAFAYLPNATAGADYRMGIGNLKGADGTGFEPSGGTCMRMFAQWEGDFWVRGNIGAPTSPIIRDVVAARRPDLPPVPVAIARGRANSSQIGFAAFKDGTILPTLMGNSGAESLDTTGIRLPTGMVPTAMAVTPYNEFLVVTVWDTNTLTGKLAFIALRPRQMAVGNPGQTPNTRWYWGTPGAWTNRGMKLLGFVDLPFAAPTSVDVSNNLVLQNPRGFGVNDDPARGDLSRQSARDLWRGVNPIYEPTDAKWHQMASAGYAIVASRAEGRVSFVDMTPLYQYFREMYLTTQANFDRTVDASTSDGAKWPFTFATESKQVPKVVTTLALAQPTAVSAGVQANAVLSNRSDDIFEWVQRSPKEGWSGAEPERYIARSRAYVATMDGTVRIFNVQGLNLPGSPVGKTVPAQTLGEFAAGRNPSFAHANASGTGSDDLFVISRGDRSVTYAWPTGQVQGVLRDSRLRDPVAGAVSINLAGHERGDDANAVLVTYITLADYNGKALFTYGVDPRRNNLKRLYPFRLPSGQSVDFLYGSRRPFPGKPFALDLEEII